MKYYLIIGAFDIQSSAGRQFLEGVPVTIGRQQHAISAPVNRILWSVQVGVVLILVGAGLWYTRGLVIEEVAQVTRLSARTNTKSPRRSPSGAGPKRPPLL